MILICEECTPKSSDVVTLVISGGTLSRVVRDYIALTLIKAW